MKTQTQTTEDRISELKEQALESERQAATMLAIGCRKGWQDHADEAERCWVKISDLRAQE